MNGACAFGECAEYSKLDASRNLRAGYEIQEWIFNRVPPKFHRTKIQSAPSGSRVPGTFSIRHRLQTKAAEVVVGSSSDSQLRPDLPHQGGECETVPRAGADEERAFYSGNAIDNKVFVSGRRV